MCKALTSHSKACTKHNNPFTTSVLILNKKMTSHTPLQPFAPSFVQPAEQSSHFMLPAVFVHLRSLWQPPLFDKHSSRSTYAYTQTTTRSNLRIRCAFVSDNNLTSRSLQKGLPWRDECICESPTEPGRVAYLTAHPVGKSTGCRVRKSQVPHVPP